jgi:hypothetical protein
VGSILFYLLLLIDTLLPPTNASTCFVQPDLVKLGKIAQGRAVLPLIKQGTRESQVKFLLGPSCGEFWSPSGAEAAYGHCGLRIFYDFSFPDRRVTSVIVYRLAPPPEDKVPQS